MADDLFMDLLLKQSVTRLREMRAQVDEKRRQLDFEAQYLDRALAEKGAAAPGEAAAASVPEPRTRRGSKREPIKQVLARDPDRYWLPSEVRDALAKLGFETTSAAVRVTMKRMLEDEELERPPDDGHGFKLAPMNGATIQAPLTEATTD